MSENTPAIDLCSCPASEAIEQYLSQEQYSYWRLLLQRIALAGDISLANTAIGSAYGYAKGLFDCRNIRAAELQAMDSLVEALARATIQRLDIHEHDVGRPKDQGRT